MKKSLLKLCLLACITLFGVACSNSVKLTGNEFIIEGIISGVEDRAVLTLSRVDDFGYRTLIASDTIKEGRFTFRGEAESNQDKLDIMSRSEGFTNGLLIVWAAPRVKIKINGTDKLIPLWEVKSSVPYQKEENRYKNNNRDIIAEIARVMEERTDLLLVKIRAAASEDEKNAYIKISDSLGVVSRSLSVKQLYNNITIMEKADINPIWLLNMRSLTFAVKNPDGLYDLDAEQSAYLRKKAEELYDRMSEKDRTSLVGYLITSQLFPSFIVEVGDDMADADMLDINGNTKRLADYFGKYILLDFWSRGCQPCIRALPEMKEVSETYSDKLTIISISIETEAGWKEATATYDMPWVNLRDQNSLGGLAATYGVWGIPNYVMISPEGKIVDKWAGYGTGYLKQKVSENIGL
jgi:peroxiredoxin